MIYMPRSTQVGDRGGLSVNATMRPEGDGGGGGEGGGGVRGGRMGLGAGGRDE